MYAIIADGSRQYKVEEGQELVIDYRESAIGEKLTFERVLAVGEGEAVQLGTPMVEGATVGAEVLGLKLGKKLVVQKIRRRKNSRRKTGHRSMLTRIKIEKISA